MRVVRAGETSEGRVDDGSGSGRIFNRGIGQGSSPGNELVRASPSCGAWLKFSRITGIRQGKAMLEG
jgi:hypothetical protein